MTTSTLRRAGIPTGTWNVDKAHTRVGFAVKSLGVSTVRGEFREFDGALEIGEDLAASRAYGRVDATSVDTNLARRDAHLRCERVDAVVADEVKIVIEVAAVKEASIGSGGGRRDA